MLNNDNQKEYSMSENGIVQEDMYHLLMKFLDHLMLMICVDMESIVEEIDQNDIILAEEVNFVRYLLIRKRV